MKLTIKTPKQSLNKAFLKQRPLRHEIDLFKDNLIRLLGKIDEIEREENQKNLIRDFLLNTYYKETNEINTKDNKDLVIHNGKTNKDSVGVIIEAKRPSNKNEMLTADKPNTKAFQELVLYYLRERIEEKNNDIKYLIATNINEWYIFEASYFEKAFYRNKAFVKQYEDWRDGKKVTKDTTLFYNEIAKPFINALEDEISCTHFDIRTYETALKNADKEDDKKLIQLFKILSPNHLLKVSFADDSNTLDEKFYKELLHIIGLEEAKDGSKFIIRRKLEDKRNAGSLLEMAISILETEDPLHRVTDIQNYGDTKEEKTYNVALELCITWINRILFLKLLEGQLVNYHKGDKAYRFLNSDMIKDFDELYKLFHQVLAKTTEERPKVIKEKYGRVPYLNSSLFEISDLEDQTLKINQLDNSAGLELINSSILKEDKKKAETLPSLEYVFRFLDAYDFASEGKEDIQEDSKKLINASVLGKVFEKINGYKDGSIFTPGFITMYMCRQSIRLAVLQKFTDKYDWKADTFDDLKNYLADKKSSKDILINNRLINSLHICDPAVGSGHFLVSSLNELIAIKSELGLLADDKGVRITDYEVTVENDELIVSDEEGEIFEYQSPLLKKGKSGDAMQRLQRTLFHEKQTIIENCLFGVDINPNSVKICRLRLWIELLKNAYYKQPDFIELETLPNIDINIKCGNSLLSRFPLDIDLTDAFKKQQFNLNTYKTAVEAYRKTSDKKAKSELTALIKKIKEEYTATIYKRDPRRKKLAEIRGQIALVQNNVDLFGTKKLTDKDKAVEERRLTLLLEQREKELQEAEQGVMYRNAFEWRFEFPEVLDVNGKYYGFDIIIGNPPYVKVQELNHLLIDWYKQNKSTAHKRIDISILFFELAENILMNKGFLSFISSNQFQVAEYGRKVREFILQRFLIKNIIDYGDLPIFEEALTYVSVFNFQKTKPRDFEFKRVLSIEEAKSMNYSDFVHIKLDSLDDNSWTLMPTKGQAVLDKLNKHEKLSTFAKCSYGIVSGSDDVFILNDDQIAELKIEKKCLLPLIRANNCKRYGFSDYNLQIIYPYEYDKGQTVLISQSDLENKYPNTFRYLSANRKILEARKDSRKTFANSNSWYSLTRFGQIQTFRKEKIVFPGEQKHSKFGIDKNKAGYSGARVFGITTVEDGYSLSLLLALLNSKVLEFYIHSCFPLKQGGYYSMSSTFVENIPIPKKPDKKTLKQIESMVDDIFRQSDGDTLVLV